MNKFKFRIFSKLSLIMLFALFCGACFKTRHKISIPLPLNSVLLSTIVCSKSDSLKKNTIAAQHSILSTNYSVIDKILNNQVVALQFNQEVLIFKIDYLLYLLKSQVHREPLNLNKMQEILQSYSKAVVVHNRFVFKIIDELDELEKSICLCNSISSCPFASLSHSHRANNTNLSTIRNRLRKLRRNTRKKIVNVFKNQYFQKVLFYIISQWVQQSVNRKNFKKTEEMLIVQLEQARSLTNTADTKISAMENELKRVQACLAQNEIQLNEAKTTLDSVPWFIKEPNLSDYIKQQQNQTSDRIEKEKCQYLLNCIEKNEIDKINKLKHRRSFVRKLPTIDENKASSSKK